MLTQTMTGGASFTDSGLCLLFNPTSYRRMTDDASLQALVHVSLDQLFLLAVPVDEQQNFHF